MSCQRCGSDNQNSFGSEVNIHFPGREGLDKPAVLVFPMLVVCQRCGFTEFTIRESELHLLAQGLSHAKSPGEDERTQGASRLEPSGLAAH